MSIVCSGVPNVKCVFSGLSSGLVNGFMSCATEYVLGDFQPLFTTTTGKCLLMMSVSRKVKSMSCI